MEFIYLLFMHVLYVLIDTFTTPLFILIYLSFFLIIAWQYKRMQTTSESILNVSFGYYYLRLAFVASILGFLGGIAASFLLIILGIDLLGIGILWLWVIAIILLLISPRFLCFAYAGGILSLLSLILGTPDINVAQLLGLVAVLHMVEAFLIFINGSFKALAVYVRKDEMNSGGFNLQKFWPLPLVALIGVGGGDALNTAMDMPHWWPIIKSYSSFLEGAVYTLVPILAVLGYGEITTTRTPNERSRKSAVYLMLYSLILLGISVLASYFYPLLFIAALFSIIGHELIIWLGMRDEKNREAIYIQHPLGLMIMDVVQNSPAQKAGLQAGDIILSIQEKEIRYHFELKIISRLGWGKVVSMQILRNGRSKSIKIKHSKNINNLGIISVPDPHGEQYLIFNEDGIFRLAQKIWGRIKK